MKIVYFFPNQSTFINVEIEVLEQVGTVKTFCLNQGSKIKLPFQLIKQFFQGLWNIPQSDFVVCHFAGYASFIPNLLGRIFGKPRFLIIGGTDAASMPEIFYGSFGRGKALEWVTKMAYKHATHILPVHERLAFQDYSYHPFGGKVQGYQHFYPAAIKIPMTPFYNAYDTTLFQMDKTTKRKPNSFISIGNLGVSTTFVRKGFDVIIALAKQRPDLNFTLIGWDGKTVIDAPENVKILPFMNQESIVQQLNQHEYYFQLSLMEGFPNALVEAMLCGCIPIGSDVSGIPFIIDNTGYVVNKHDVEVLNSVVTKALAEGYSLEKGKAARKRIEDNFTFEHKRKDYEELIKQYVK